MGMTGRPRRPFDDSDRLATGRPRPVLGPDDPRRQPFWRHPLARTRIAIDETAGSSPARLALIVFLVAITVFTALLSLPVATRSGEPAPFPDALFTAVSSVCVTGLSTVDTATYWSGFGQAVILVAIQIGGLGILTLASVMGLMVAHRLGFRSRLVAAEQIGTTRLGEVGGVLRAVGTTSIVVESAVALALIPRFWTLGESLGSSVWHGVFYAISSFNNAGFAPNPQGLTPYAGDPWIIVPIMVAVLVGSLGFPVVFTLSRHWRHPRVWDLHTKLTLTTTALLFAAGALVLGALEWTNPATLGRFPVGQRLWEAVFAGAMPRSAGFATFPMENMGDPGLLVTDMLMFIGGGSSSTAGGIKVSTLAVLVLAAVAEARGQDDIQAFSRRIDPSTLRLAVSVTMAGALVVSLATLALLIFTHLPLNLALFEVVSAFATSGLSTGVTAGLGDVAKYLLATVMLVGRIGTVTLAAALALRQAPRRYRFPVERPIVG